MKTIVASHNPDLARDFDRDLLRRSDLRLVTARDGQELVERLRAGADLCFIDRVLPDGDAETILHTIRAEKALAAIPIVMVTTTGAPASDRAQARAQGFADLVELPAAPGALSLLCARLLGMPLRGEDRFAVRVHVFGADADAAKPAADGHGPYLGTSVDLSENGILLKAKHEARVGSILSLRFTLPGRIGELAVHGRVVRTDDPALAPSKSLALAFEDLSAAERAALHEYLKVLVGTRPFRWEISDQGGQKTVALHGVLRGDSDIEALRHLRGEVYFRMRDFRRISSDSVQRWIELVRDLGEVSAIRLLECPISFIHQANLITNLLDRQEVVSFFAPYACDRCGLEEEKLLDVSKDLAGGAKRAPPSFSCTSCGGPLAFDDLVEQYFAFLDR